MSAAFLPSASDELNFDAHGLPDTLRPMPTEGHVVDEFVVQHLSSLHHEQATFKTAVATTVQMLIGQVKAVSDKCEAITTENARLAGKMDTVLTLLSTRSSPATFFGYGRVFNLNFVHVCQPRRKSRDVCVAFAGVVRVSACVLCVFVVLQTPLYAVVCLV